MPNSLSRKFCSLTEQVVTGLISGALCVVILVFWEADGISADGRNFALESRPYGLVAQKVLGSSSDVGDVPLLPSPPDGPSVPLPPAPAPAQKPPGKPAPAPNGNNLSEGIGKYNAMILIPAGPFEMGSPAGEGRPDEWPRHQVFLKDFYIAKHEVTVEQFCRFLQTEGEMSRDGSPRVKFDSPDCPIAKSGKNFRPKDGFADTPMVCVSWYGATEYAEWAGGRLPTAAEREKAALLTTPDPPPDRLSLQSTKQAAAVTAAIPGARGITGMIGNVWEWCSDWYTGDYYAQSSSPNPTGPPLGQEKEIRGGSWAAVQASTRIQNRHKACPRGYFRTVGFRIVKD